LPELFRQTGRRPRGLALRSLFRVPLVRQALNELGMVEGSRRNAIELLSDDELVITYPGGARDSIKGRHNRYELQWGERRGFAHVALKAGVPVVPVAGIGPDDAFPIQSNEGVFSMPFLGDKSYKVPFFVPIARPVPFAFRFGEPIEPPEKFRQGEVEPDDEETTSFARQIEGSLQGMLDRHQTDHEPLLEVLSGLLDRLKRQ
jgi:1-acyl-sn-glycerol-3-phosphate acyltransferase